MCLNSGGGNDNGQIFSKKNLEGGKWQRGENDRGYYGIRIFHKNLHPLLLNFSMFLLWNFSEFFKTFMILGWSHMDL